MSNRGGLTPMFSDDDLNQWFEAFQENGEKKILSLLLAAGEMFVKYARELHTYEDQTGNLRSSIGYIVLRDGEEVSSSTFGQVYGSGENSALVNFKTKDGKTVKFHGKGKSGDGSTGSSSGRQLAKQIALSYPSGLILIGVAGMQYAAAVEAKGYDVVTGACSQAEAYMREAIQKAFERIE